MPPGAKCTECDAGDAGTTGPSTVKLPMLGTLITKFAFQKQTLAALAVSGATANAVGKFAALTKRK